MLRIIKNEYIKFFCGKKPYVFLIVIAVMAFLSAYMYEDSKLQIINNTIKSQQLSSELKEMLLNITPITFLKLFATDFIYKPVLQCLLIVISIIAVNIFCEDYTSGNMKFFLISRRKKTQLILAKLIFLITIIIIIVIANIIMGYLAGIAFFGREALNLKELGEVLLLYAFSVLPTFAYAIIVAILSILLCNTSIMLPIAIFLPIILSTLDLYTPSKYFSPVGTMSLIGFGLITRIPIKDFLITNGVSFLYIAIGIIVLTKMIKRKDILL